MGVVRGVRWNKGRGRADEKMHDETHTLLDNIAKEEFFNIGVWSVECGMCGGKTASAAIFHFQVGMVARPAISASLEKMPPINVRLNSSRNRCIPS